MWKIRSFNETLVFTTVPQTIFYQIELYSNGISKISAVQQ